MVDIIMRETSTLRPDGRNVNTHSEEQVAQIVASIRDFGFNDPIALDQNGVIIEGHGRQLAAMRLGMAEVPTITIHFASDAERRAYAIAHNQTQLCSTMDDGIVLDEFQRMGISRGQYQAIGYTADDIAFMELDRQMGSDEGQAAASEGFAARKAPTTDLEFQDQAQMMDWLAALDWLRDRYPDAMTVAERMTMLAADYRDAL